MKKRKGLLSLWCIFMLMVQMIFSSGNIVLANPSVLEQGKEIIRTYYLKEVSEEVLNKDTLQEVVAALNDPYSAFFSNEEFQSFVDSVNNEYYGLGIRFEFEEKGTRILEVISNSSAEKAGLQAGDLITHIGEVDLSTISSEELPQLLIDSKSKSLSLKIEREGNKHSFLVTTEKLIFPTVVSEILEGELAHIVIASFGEATAKEFTEVLGTLRKQNPKGYIIDLRYNGGGYLGAALDIAGHFIGERTAVQIRERGSAPVLYEAVNHGVTIDKPTIFLTNEGTASASEMLSAAVKDYNKAIFIGQTTYGKGVAQSIFPLQDGSVLKLTTEQFYSPKGRSIQGKGITPHLLLEEQDPLQMASLLLSSSEKHSPKGYLKITMDEQVFEVNLQKAQQPLYWKAFQILWNQLSVNQVAIGTEDGYIPLAKTTMPEFLSILYGTHTILPEIKKNSQHNQGFTVQFNKEIDMASLLGGGLEVIKEETGERLQIKIERKSSTTIYISPQEVLERGAIYDVIVNEGVKDQQGRKMKKGTLVRCSIE